jgi:hypothetical protein
LSVWSILLRFTGSGRMLNLVVRPAEAPRIFLGLGERARRPPGFLDSRPFAVSESFISTSLQAVATSVELFFCSKQIGTRFARARSTHNKTSQFTTSVFLLKPNKVYYVCNVSRMLRSTNCFSLSVGETRADTTVRTRVGSSSLPD